MMEKVKITREVADAIETLRNAEYGDYGIVTLTKEREKDNFRSLINPVNVLTDWIWGDDGGNADLLLDALRIGYEVEPEYKVGDWINWHGSIERIKNPQTQNHVDDGNCYFTLIRSDGTVYTNILRGEIRHATPEEIKAEQERRLWKSIGREVGEFRDRDFAFSEHTGYHSHEAHVLHNWYVKGKLKGFYPAESFISFGGREE